LAKVLVIDDSSFQRKWIVRTVQAMGHHTVEAANGRDGLAMIDAEKPECITIDLNMPEMNGLEFLEEAKTRNITTPVIVVTADIQAATKRRCEELGAVAFLNKPFKPSELETAMQKHVQAPARKGQ
jgi:two-component system chemotaxis response regulator CheY